MSDHPTDSAKASASGSDERSGNALLARALRRARWTIFWERLWPALAGIATVIGLFLAVSWLGLWLWLPPIGRAIGLGVFFLLTAAAFAPLLMVRIPTAQDGLRRLDRNSGRPHRPATAIADDIAAPTEDTFATALWRAHIVRALSAAKTLKAGVPAPRVASRDPYALRALVAVLVVATFFAAGSDRLRRIAAAFDWQGVMAPANYRIDAWVSPPNYTGKPPVILPGLRAGEPIPRHDRDVGAGRQHAGHPRDRTGATQRGHERRPRRAEVGCPEGAVERDRRAALRDQRGAAPRRCAASLRAT